ncbi:MAG TPA: hypothetical protein VH393_00395 [Ktedonobacterales bacterium]|jgi:hypothetical protein
MRRHRYQRPESVNPEDERLPLDTICTILTRQSTFAQGKRNLFSDEVNPDDLVREARRLGFADNNIQVLDWDMGKGAYNTTIEDRPALRHWVNELLPSGVSRVVMASQEDRLFRDRTEIQVNTFIEQVAQHRGWVVCGTRIYNLRRDMDKEQFRFACKAGKYFIEYHLKGRLLPARHRAALSGRHVGGPVPWGYIVDYDPRSATHMHYQRYEPHAALVADQIFHRFARMAHPSLAELARSWRREGLVFPYFQAEVDERRRRWVDAHCTADPERGGYILHPDQVHRILTDVSYLGWRVRTGALALDEQGAPKVCHAPLVEADLFWWCFDLVLPARPEGAPPRPVDRHFPTSRYRPRQARRATIDEVVFLAPGRLYCAVHGTRYAPARKVTGQVELQCGSQSRELAEQGEDCPIISAPSVEEALCDLFVEQLTLDEQDVSALARLAHERTSRQQGDLGNLRLQLEEYQALYERAKRRALQIDDEEVAADFLSEAGKARKTVRELEHRIAAYREHDAPSTDAWLRAERAAKVAERIRQTFPLWPRQYQAPVLSLALAEGALGHVSRKVLGLWIRWQGGVESRRELLRARGQRLEWTPAEEAALHAWYDRLTWEALCAMLPTRSRQSIEKHASQLRVSRHLGGEKIALPPLIVSGPLVRNTMGKFGFPLGALTDQISTRTP